MANLNRFQFIGRLGKDPERDSDTQPARFSLAVETTWKEGEEKKKRTDWFNVIAWNGLAATVMQYLKKGATVFVEGSIRTSEWDDKETGQKKYKTEYVATDIKFLDKKPAEEPKKRK